MSYSRIEAALRCEARGVKLYSFGTANPENEADGAGSVRPEGKNAL